MQKLIKKISLIIGLTSLFILTSCYSVFSGGTGGIIVDAESTSTPKAGIANVDIYAYTDAGTRDADYNNWREGTTFAPSNSYYGHTTTSADGTFTISKIVWKETAPDFGRDADFTTIYLLYYHQNYGLTKDATVITSDSMTDTVYAELTAVRKTTNLNIEIYDVANNSRSSNNIMVKVSIPQSTETITASPKIYEQTITGSGTISISYPRWTNASNKENKIENTPEVTIQYYQSSDEITWKACANANNTERNYAFLADNASITKTIQNSNYTIQLYGKSTRLYVPTVNGVYSSGSGNLDGHVIKMMARDSSGNLTIDCGETSTVANTIGTSGTQTHGNFSGLGNNAYWTDTEYTGKYATIQVQFYVDGTATGSLRTLRSDQSSYSVEL